MKLSRRDFLKSAGKGTAAVAVAGTALVTGEAVAKAATDKVDNVPVKVDKLPPVSTPEHARWASESILFGNTDLHTRDLHMVNFSFNEGSHDVSTEVLFDRPRSTPAFNVREIEIDMYIDSRLDGAAQMLRLGDQYRLHVDHNQCPEHIRGVYNVVVTRNDITSAVDSLTTASVTLKEIV